MRSLRLLWPPLTSLLMAAWRVSVFVSSWEKSGADIKKAQTGAATRKIILIAIRI